MLLLHPAPTCADGCWCPVPLTFSNLRWWCFSFQQLAQTLYLHLWWLPSATCAGGLFPSTTCAYSNLHCVVVVVVYIYINFLKVTYNINFNNNLHSIIVLIRSKSKARGLLAGVPLSCAYIYIYTTIATAITTTAQLQCMHSVYGHCFRKKTTTAITQCKLQYYVQPPLATPPPLQCMHSLYAPLL